MGGPLGEGELSDGRQDHGMTKAGSPILPVFVGVTIYPCERLAIEDGGFHSLFPTSSFCLVLPKPTFLCVSTLSLESLNFIVNVRINGVS